MKTNAELQDRSCRYLPKFMIVAGSAMLGFRATTGPAQTYTVLHITPTRPGT